MKNPIEINLRSSAIQHFLIWEELHKLYSQHHPEICWDLMCDYEIIKKYLASDIAFIYWCFASDVPGQTHIYRSSEEPFPLWADQCYRIEIDREKQIAKITKI